MHRVDHSRFRHRHDFVHDFCKGERRTHIVIAITGVMMVVEITAGLLSHSMALLASGNCEHAAPPQLSPKFENAPNSPAFLPKRFQFVVASVPSSVQEHAPPASH
jgi:hypothetical protein